MSRCARCRAHHVHDLHEAEAEVDGERVGVVEHRPLQRVVVPHQVLVETPLVLSLLGD